MTGCSSCCLLSGERSRGVGVLVWLCACLHVSLLVLTKFSVKSYSNQRAIGTAQSITDHWAARRRSRHGENDWLKT